MEYHQAQIQTAIGCGGRHHITQPRFRELLQAVLNSVIVEEARNAAANNRKFLHLMLLQIQNTNLGAEGLQRLNELDVVQEVSDDSVKPNVQPIDRSVNSYTLEVGNVLNSPRTRR